MLTYDAVDVRQLDASVVAQWTALLPHTGDLSSPFFRPEYAQCVAAVRPGIRAVVIRDDGRIAGFHPFERLSDQVARPVGGGMSNFQGVIAEPGLSWTATELARAARVDVLKFHHQLSSQREFDAFTMRRAPSPVVELGAGWDAYLEQRRRDGTSSFNALPRKMRKLERELGPISFVAHTDDDAVLASLVEWKRAQYVRTESHGSLEHEWAVAVLREIMKRQSPGFAGMLSALYAGDRLIAVHAGMRSATCWHYWYPAYDPELGNYSPGLVLMFEMCRWAAASGIARIDLGPGEGSHKELFRTSETEVRVGQVALPRSAGWLSHVLGRLRRVASPRKEA